MQFNSYAQLPHSHSHFNYCVSFVYISKKTGYFLLISVGTQSVSADVSRILGTTIEEGFSFFCFLFLQTIKKFSKQFSMEFLVGQFVVPLQLATAFDHKR